MALPFTTDEVYILRPPIVVDAHGNRSRTTKDWGNAARLGPHEVCVQPDAATMGASLATKENRNGGREQLEKTIVVFFEPDADVSATDAVEWDGVVYQVDGTPHVLPDVGGLGHLVLKAYQLRG